MDIKIRGNSGLSQLGSNFYSLTEVNAEIWDIITNNIITTYDKKQEVRQSDRL